MCFWETYRLSYKTIATLNLHNTDLSLSEVLWSATHLSGTTIYLWNFKAITKAVTNPFGIFFLFLGAQNSQSYKSISIQVSWYFARLVLFPEGATESQKSDCPESHRE
jgi:hypothetical protein